MNTRDRKDLTGKPVGRPPRRLNNKTLDLIQLWDQCANQHGHPAEWLYKVMHGKIKISIVVDGQIVTKPPGIDVRMQAAELLLKYRYPQHLLNANPNGAGGQLVLTWEDHANPEGEGRDVLAAQVERVG